MKFVNLNDHERARDELLRAINSQHPETVARAAIANVWPLYNAHFALLTEAVAALPNSVLDRYPILRVLHPMTAVLARSSRPFKPAVSADDARTISPEELDFLTLAQMIAFRFNGDMPGALGYARRLEDRILQTRLESRDRMDGPLWYFHHQIGSTLLAAGDSSKALLEFATARQLGQFAQQPDAERVVLGRAALAHALRGTLGDAERALAEARALPATTAAHTSSSRAAENTAAALMAVDRMPEAMDDALDALEPFDSVDLSWPFALLARCRAFLA
ncbi:hypothetical protein M0722_16440, partial [Microbacterium sp. KSW4-16]|uniref:hypothetical protein n=1 Tax=Microbacterium aurugineum TaxID=2851642 RepID=UPI0020BDE0DD